MGIAIKYRDVVKGGGSAKKHSDTGKSMKRNSPQAIAASESALDAMRLPIRITKAAWIRTRTNGMRKRVISCPPYSGRLGTEK